MSKFILTCVSETSELYIVVRKELPEVPGKAEQQAIDISRIDDIVDLQIYIQKLMSFVMMLELKLVDFTRLVAYIVEKYYNTLKHTYGMPDNEQDFYEILLNMGTQSVISILRFANDLDDGDVGQDNMQ